MEINPLKCYNCGKVFRDKIDITRHKNRKTPCLIREVAPEHVNSPNRCIFCNKVFSNLGNKNKHLATCKIKNGGMDLLVDKVKYEQEIRILKERDVEKDRKIQELENKLRDRDALIDERFAKLEAREVQPQIINNGIINNNTINNTITINQFNRPSIDHLIDKENVKNGKLFKLIQTRRLRAPIEVIPMLYYNPDAPENFSIYMNNKKTGETAYLADLTWKVGNINDKFGHDLFEGVNDVIESYIRAHMEDFNSWCMPSQELLDKLQSGRSTGKLQEHYVEELREHMIAGRETVDSTVKPLIKHL